MRRCRRFGEDVPMNDRPETLFRRGHCWACGDPLREPHKPRGYCSWQCRLDVADWEECTELRFLLTNMRAYGGNGFGTLEERMAEAVEQLPIDDGLLALLLIEILEILDRDEASKK